MLPGGKGEERSERWKDGRCERCRDVRDGEKEDGEKKDVEM